MQENFTLSIMPDNNTEPIPLDIITGAIKARTAMVTENIIFIGRMLLDAKAQLEHGAFTDWLRDGINYSHSTANSFMRIAREIPIHSPLTALPHSKVLMLLDVPAEEREQFAEENHVDDLSVRDLKQLLKEKEAAQREAEKQRKEAVRYAEYAERAAQAHAAIEHKYVAAQTEIAALKNTPPRTVVEHEEVIPPDYEDLKTDIASERARAEDAVRYAQEQEAALQAARSELRALRDGVKQEGTRGQAFSPAVLGDAVRAFIAQVALAPHLMQEYRIAPPDELADYTRYLNIIADWVEGMRSALDGSAMLIDAGADALVV